MSDRRNISVVVPCLNEEENLGLLAERLFSAAANHVVTVELVAVDDGSTDGTWSVIEDLEREHEGAVVGVRHPSNRGIPSAWASGTEAAVGRFICFIDADLQHRPEDVFTLYERLRSTTSDLAQGVRSTLGRNRQDPRFVASRGLNSLLNVAFRSRSRDSKSGFVLAPKAVIEDVIRHRRKYHYFQTFITVAARAKGYSIVEVDTVFEERHAGASFIAGKTLSTSTRAMIDIPRALREFGRPRHPYRYNISNSVAPKPDHHPYQGWRRVLFEAYFATMPLHKWMLRKSARDIYLQLKATEWLDRETLTRLQLEKLQRVVQHAYVHVPYYREQMRRANVEPTDIEQLSDIERLPLLSKAAVRENLHYSLIADDHDPRTMLRIVTSGSTGEPFVTYADKYQLEVRFATTLRALEWTGWRFGDRQARLWHQTLGMSRSQIIRERIDSWFMRRLFIPAFEITPDNIEEFIGAVRDHEPVLVDGYAESLNFLASYVSAGGNPRFSPRAMMSSAQALPDSTRESIETGFATRVYDKYGSREFSGIAYQCDASDDHHVMDESYLVELLVDGRPARPGEIGEVVITDLNNFSVPLIRYRIGDLAAAVDDSEPCACGRSLSRIGRIEGRTQAIVHCANGAWLPGSFFLHFFKEYDDAVRHFQVYQEVPGAFTIRIVPGDAYSDEVSREMLRQLVKYVGSETAIALELTEAIPMVRTGKRSPVVSLVEEDFQAVRGRPGRV